MTGRPFILNIAQPSPDWFDKAACHGADPALFFPDKGEQGGRGAQQSPAKTVCNACPVRGACLDWALETGERHGIWGGLTVKERQQETRRRRRAA